MLVTPLTKRLLRLACHLFQCPRMLGLEASSHRVRRPATLGHHAEKQYGDSKEGDREKEMPDEHQVFQDPRNLDPPSTGIPV